MPAKVTGHDNGRNKHRDAMAGRLAALIVRIQRGGLPSLDELARAHGVCKRTIRRDLEAIELVMPVRWRKEAA